MTRGQILRDALEVINGERQDVYGDPEDSFALIAEYWNVYLRDQNHDFNDLDSKDVAYMMTLFKLAREAHQHKRDNLVDAAGYLGIAGDMHNVNETDFVKIAGEPGAKFYGLFSQALDDDPDTINDGHGNYWDKWCPDCGAEMEIVRPGKVQCSKGCGSDQLPADTDILNNHSERTAAEGVEETLRWRQGQPGLADLVDWDCEEAEGMVWFAQDPTGDCAYFPSYPKWLPEQRFWDDGNPDDDAYASRGVGFRPLAHDWQTPLKRPADHSYTDEEPEHRIQHRDSGAPSDMPYAEIPATDEEDEDFELMNVRRWRVEECKLTDNGDGTVNISPGKIWDCGKEGDSLLCDLCHRIKEQKLK